jgi:hypothetical protein
VNIRARSLAQSDHFAARAARVFLACALVHGCAFPRFATPLNPLPEGRVPSEEFPEAMYTLQLLGANVPAAKVSGLPWDDDGSGPDPFVRIYVEHQLVFESKVLENDHRPRWNVELPRNVRIPQGSDFRLEVWDQDSAVTADPIGRLERRGLPPSAVRGARARLELEGRAVVTILLGPPRPHQGIGVSVELRSDALRVFAVEPYSPAARAELHAGDRIVSIGGQRVEDVGPERALGLLSLAAERRHKLGVEDADGNQPRELTLDRGYTWLVM